MGEPDKGPPAQVSVPEEASARPPSLAFPLTRHRQAGPCRELQGIPGKSPQRPAGFQTTRWLAAFRCCWGKECAGEGGCRPPGLTAEGQDQFCPGPSWDEQAPAWRSSPPPATWQAGGEAQGGLAAPPLGAPLVPESGSRQAGRGHLEGGGAKCPWAFWGPPEAEMRGLLPLASSPPPRPHLHALWTLDGRGGQAGARGWEGMAGASLSSRGGQGWGEASTSPQEQEVPFSPQGHRWAPPPSAPPIPLRARVVSACGHRPTFWPGVPGLKGLPSEESWPEAALPLVTRELPPWTDPSQPSGASRP